MDLLLYANYYRNLGFNITHLSGNKNKSYKEPTDPNSKLYIYEKQTVKYIFEQSWNEATGIGMLLGYNNYRAIDIDKFNIHPCLLPEENEQNQKEFVQKCLELLGLPKDYSWVVKSGSKQGLHIIIKTDDINDLVSI